MLLENVVGSTTKVKMLRLFYEYPNRSFTTKEVISDAKIGAGYGLKCLIALEESGVIVLSKVGREKRYRLNVEGPLYEALNDMFSKEKRQYPGVSYIHRAAIAEIAEKLPGEGIVLFGSVAAGTATTDSDIDLFIVTERPQEAKRIVDAFVRKTGVKLHAVVFTPEKMEEYARRKDRLLAGISKEHVIVKGNWKLRETIDNV